jgi:hypothetical protein
MTTRRFLRIVLTLAALAPGIAACAAGTGGDSADACVRRAESVQVRVATLPERPRYQLARVDRAMDLCRTGQTVEARRLLREVEYFLSWRLESPPASD